MLFIEQLSKLEEKIHAKEVGKTTMQAKFEVLPLTSLFIWFSDSFYAKLQ